MINLPRINITSNKSLLIILFMSIIFYTLIYLDINKIAVMIFILLFFVFYGQVMKNTNSFFFKKRDRGENYNNRIEELLYELKVFEKISPYKYNEGYNIWVKFIKTIDKLESDKLYNYNHYFENAHQYLRDSCNIFMGITVGSKERKYIDGMEYGDFENSKDLKKGGRIVKELYKEGYGILYNLSLRLNKQWEEGPNIHNKEILFNSPEPYDYKNKIKNKFDYF
tara:strand:+ start:3812 stop:4483 length:672 start_codon:yes stop_codon:yes gene_type:complete